VFGPYFLEDEMNTAITDTSNHYQTVTTTFLAPTVEHMMNEEWNL
jgi:hypothetical protein